MKLYTSKEPVFEREISIIETTDTGHADNINITTKQLLQNTLVLADFLEMLCDNNTIENSFYAVFTLVKLADETAMTIADIHTAIATVWEGETSMDKTAMSALDVKEAVNTDWKGESSVDEAAMTIKDVITATK